MRKSRLAKGAAALIAATALTVPAATGQPTASDQPSSSAPDPQLIGRISPAHMATPKLQLYLYGVYGVGQYNAVFRPKLIKESAPQKVLTYIRVPDSARHSYRLKCDVDGRGAAGTQTRYRFYDGSTYRFRQVPQGPRTLSFDVSLRSSHAWWWFGTLENRTDDAWLFIGCDVYELL